MKNAANIGSESISDSLEVTLSVELDRIKARKADVETYGVGHLLPITLSQHNSLTLCANGKAVATGHLVNVSNGTAFQIIEFI